MDLDNLLPDIGDFGRYQKLLLWLICLPACIPCGFCAFNQLFMTDAPDDYWCFVPELQNLSMIERKNLSIPFNEVFYSIYSFFKLFIYMNYEFNLISKYRLQKNIVNVQDMQ